MAKSESELVNIEIAYAISSDVVLIPLKIEKGTMVSDALKLSGILNDYPEIDFTVHTLAIYGKRIVLEQILQDGDRIEILQPLKADPKEARRRRARQQNQSQQ